MTQEFEGVLEIDTERGVIYFHASHPRPEWATVTLLRICRLQIPKGYDPRLDQIDITEPKLISYGRAT